MTTDREETFLGGLFDFSFSQFIAVDVVKVLYAFAIALAGLGVIAGVAGAFASSFWGGLLSLVFAPIVFILWVLIARVWLELFVVIFRIADHTRETAENTSK